jgi:hypothetical protein
MPLKSIILLFLSQIPCISFSQFKSSNQVKRCMNWKDIEFQASKKYEVFHSQGDMIICGLCQYHSYFSQLLKFSLSSSLIVCPVKTGVSGFAKRTVRFWSPDMSGLYTGFQYGFLDLSGNLPGHVQPLSKNLNLDQNPHFLYIPSIYLDLCDHVKILWCLNMK